MHGTPARVRAAWPPLSRAQPVTLTVIGEGSAAGTWTFDPKLNRTYTATQGASNGVVSDSSPPQSWMSRVAREMLSFTSRLPATSSLP